MRYLDQARALCESYLPGLLDGLSKVPFEQREASGGGTLPVFRASGGPSLVIPRDYGGLGASPLDAIRVTRAIGGNQLVVFDPHSVVVVNDEDSDPPRVMTTDELEEAALVNEALAFGAPSVEADCFMCRHFIPSGFPHCAAYPDGIPWEIQAGEVDHRQPWAGDHGIRYEPLTSEEFHARAAELRAAAARLRRRGAAD